MERSPGAWWILGIWIFWWACSAVLLDSTAVVLLRAGQSHQQQLNKNEQQQQQEEEAEEQVALAGATRTTTPCTHSSCPSLAGVITTRILVPFIYRGNRQEDYDWNTHSEGAAWIQAKATAVRDPVSFAALLEAMDAEAYWGKRVRLRAYVSVRDVSGGSFAALFVRVVSRGGWTLAFDNMRRRRIMGVSWYESWQNVVLDVPMPPVSDNGESCPSENLIPATVQAGMLLGGGRGFIGVEGLFLDTVGPDVPVTGGPAPWTSPGPDI